MWTRSLLKQNAKMALTGRYWRCFLVCLVLGLLGGSIVNTASHFNQADAVFSGEIDPYRYGEIADYYLSSIPPAMFGVAAIVALVSIIIGLCWNIFLLGPLEVGKCRYFMESRQGAAPYDTVTGIFRTPYANVVTVQLLVRLKIFLGYLLVIPGIYWSYCYMLVPYLLAENPYFTASHAMELSKELMNGEKWNFFKLEISFFGWYLLGAITVIGGFFVDPYVQATYAEFYAAMRSKALSEGLSNSQELGGFVRHDSV